MISDLVVLSRTVFALCLKKHLGGLCFFLFFFSAGKIFVFHVSTFFFGHVST